MSESQQEGQLVFSHHCTSCDQTQLIFPSQLRSIDTTDHGLEVRFECWCGASQLMVTGNRARTSVAA
jgi:hypothetical protein